MAEHGTKKKVKHVYDEDLNLPEARRRKVSTGYSPNYVGTKGDGLVKVIENRSGAQKVGAQNKTRWKSEKASIAAKTKNYWTRYVKTFSEVYQIKFSIAMGHPKCHSEYKNRVRNKDEIDIDAYIWPEPRADDFGGYGVTDWDEAANGAWDGNQDPALLGAPENDHRVPVHPVSRPPPPPLPVNPDYVPPVGIEAAGGVAPPVVAAPVIVPRAAAAPVAGGHVVVEVPDDDLLEGLGVFLEENNQPNVPQEDNNQPNIPQQDEFIYEGFGNLLDFDDDQVPVEQPPPVVEPPPQQVEQPPPVVEPPLQQVPVEQPPPVVPPPQIIVIQVPQPAAAQLPEVVQEILEQRQQRLQQEPPRLVLPSPTDTIKHIKKLLENVSLLINTTTSQKAMIELLNQYKNGGIESLREVPARRSSTSLHIDYIDKYVTLSRRTFYPYMRAFKNAGVYSQMFRKSFVTNVKYLLKFIHDGCLTGTITQEKIDLFNSSLLWRARTDNNDRTLKKLFWLFYPYTDENTVSADFPLRDLHLTEINRGSKRFQPFGIVSIDLSSIPAEITRFAYLIGARMVDVLDANFNPESNEDYKADITLNNYLYSEIMLLDRPEKKYRDNKTQLIKTINDALAKYDIKNYQITKYKLETREIEDPDDTEKYSTFKFIFKATIRR